MGIPKEVVNVSSFQPLSIGSCPLPPDVIDPVTPAVSVSLGFLAHWFVHHTQPEALGDWPLLILPKVVLVLGIECSN